MIEPDSGDGDGVAAVEVGRGEGVDGGCAAAGSVHTPSNSLVGRMKASVFERSNPTGQNPPSVSCDASQSTMEAVQSVFEGRPDTLTMGPGACGVVATDSSATDHERRSREKGFKCPVRVSWLVGIVLPTLHLSPSPFLFGGHRSSVGRSRQSRASSFNFG